MKKLSIIAILALLTITSFAQKRQFKITDKSLLIKPTEVVAKNFKMRQAKTAYDLALNFAYFHHQSSGSKNEFLTLPVVLIEDNPAFEDQLKQIEISELSLYNFKNGKDISALYGTRSTYGLLTIKLKKND